MSEEELTCLKPPDKPQNLDELFKFYDEFVKVLYSYVQSQNILPQETLFEINAAFDHLSRIYIYDEPEDSAIDKVYGHLKRSCLDIFKVQVKEARRHYIELHKLDLTVVDNGKFAPDLNNLYVEIKRKARDARRLEGEWVTEDENTHAAFDRWQEVMALCLKLESDYYLHPRVKWVKRKKIASTIWHWAGNIAIGLILLYIGQKYFN